MTLCKIRKICKCGILILGKTLFLAFKKTSETHIACPSVDFIYLHNSVFQRDAHHIS